MSIRFKLLLCIILSITTLTGVLYAIATTVIFKSYVSIEHEQDVQNLVRVEQALTDYNDSIAVKLRDWSHWDDLYTFISGNNQSFKDSILQSSSLQTLEINSLVLITNAKEVAFAKNIEIKKGDDLQNTNVTNEILVHKKITALDTEKSSVEGLVQTDAGLLFIDASPILHSDSSGPVNGSIIFGRFIDADIIKNIDEVTQLSVQLFSYSDNALPTDVAQAKKMLSLRNKYVLSPVSSNEMIGYLLLSDIDDQPVGIMRISMPRAIYSQGKSTLITFIATSSFFILLFGALIIFLVNRLLFARLTRLNTEILKINPQSDIRTVKVTEGTNDEMGTLARKINVMLEGLFTAQSKEREAYKLQLEASKLLHQQQKDTENMTRIMVEREIKMNELNKEIAALKDKIQP